jgi:hypothetical protein
MMGLLLLGRRFWRCCLLLSSRLGGSWERWWCWRVSDGECVFLSVTFVLSKFGSRSYHYFN